MSSINWLAVLVAAIIQFVIGWAWYSPYLFGRKWLALKGAGADPMKGQSPAKAMAGSFVAGLISAAVLAYMVVLTGVTTFGGGLWLGTLLWLGFVGAVMITDVLFDGKKPGLYLISAGYFLVAFALMGAVLAVWQ